MQINLTYEERKLAAERALAKIPRGQPLSASRYLALCGYEEDQIRKAKQEAAL